MIAQDSASVRLHLCRPCPAVDCPNAISTAPHAVLRPVAAHHHTIIELPVPSRPAMLTYMLSARAGWS